ncbi:hypothetical protein R5R35_006189 [Gryllus longicercus]|uniref:Protein FAM122A n=1 Tax=Gryllus longicercus TaxID=2509291 RepID=A0AAN9VJB9_9ORTH
MDVDSPVGLKRSSSAPMINELNTTMTTASTSSSTRDSSPFNIFPAQTRTRRFSASFSPVHSPSGPGPRLTPRVSQLKQEECVDVVGREAAHERELHTAMQMSQSWEDLALVGNSPTPRKADMAERTNRGVCDFLQLTLPQGPPVCSSPSPTRLGRQGLPMNWKSTLSPSPTRTFTRRSQSPIAMRPSSLGPVKRKCEMDEDKGEPYMPPAKRLSCSGLLVAHAGRPDAAASPLPGSLSSVGTPDSLSSADSPGFTFRPVDSPSPGRGVPAGPTDEPMNEEPPLETGKTRPGLS